MLPKLLGLERGRVLGMLVVYTNCRLGQDNENYTSSKSNQSVSFKRMAKGARFVTVVQRNII